MRGEDVLVIGTTRIGQRYVLGAEVPLDNRDWTGPWDCAEFASWCAFQAYGLIFGAGGAASPAQARPYSGYWRKDAIKRGRVISWRDALSIPGAALIRAPRDGVIGHVAFAYGDGERTLEARSAAQGVGIFPGAQSRAWTIGCLLPGVSYPGESAISSPGQIAVLPPNYLWLKRPNFRGADIIALQSALKAAGIDSGRLDGSFGPFVNAALISFQAEKGLEVDGVFGPNTAKALGVDFPIKPTQSDRAAFDEINRPAEYSFQGHNLIDAVVRIVEVNTSFLATSESGRTFFVGKRTTYRQGGVDRIGLKSTAESATSGVYSAGDYAQRHRQWAHFIEPTLTVEGEGRFAALNTYDRVAFTFGAPQFAAHTPESNLVVYLKRLLSLQDAAAHFPELSLRVNAAGKETLHRVSGGVFIDLEEVTEIARPNGEKDKQLRKLMSYLNPSPDRIDEEELYAAARLINWLQSDDEAKRLQIALFIEQARAKLIRTRTKVPEFTGRDWRIALWVMDIQHHGRARKSGELAAALRASAPEAALRAIGKTKYQRRINSIAAAIEEIQAAGTLDGFDIEQPG